MHRIRFDRLAIVLSAAAAIAGCGPGNIGNGHVPGHEDDFAALQVRGEQVMGVDQYTSTHRFDALPDGGRIELQRDTDDPAGIERIREHFATIAEAFAAGDFSLPAVVHLQEVPGTAVMAAKKDRIEYVVRELPRGAELRLVTDDPEALRAIHEFMAFQRDDHRAGGIDHGAHGDGGGHHHHAPTEPDAGAEAAAPAASRATP